MARYPMICILFLYIIFPLLIKSTQFYLLACSALSYHLVSYTISFLRVSHPLSAVSDTIRDLQPQICSLQRQPYTWSCNQQAVWNDNSTFKASTATSRSATTNQVFAVIKLLPHFVVVVGGGGFLFVCLFLQRQAFAATKQQTSWTTNVGWKTKILSLTPQNGFAAENVPQVLHGK